MKKALFASDFHLGMPDCHSSRKREDKIVSWLNKYAKDVDEVYFLGDVFDFWFEYKRAIPKGYMRLFGKLAQLADSGVQLYFFKGNHDMWLFDYFEKELNAKIISDELELEIEGKRFFMHHGDGLGPGDYSYKFLKKFFRSRLCQWLFARLHPNFGIGLASYFSKSSRMAKGSVLPHQGAEKELIEQYVLEQDQKNRADFYLCGHRHLAEELILPSGAKYINTGEWFMQCSYAYFNGMDIELRYFENELLA